MRDLLVAIVILAALVLAFSYVGIPPHNNYAEDGNEGGMPVAHGVGGIVIVDGGNDLTVYEQTPTPQVKKSNADIAREVINGKWSNGTDRKKKLAAAGYNYKAVQAIVNELLA